MHARDRLVEYVRSASILPGRRSDPLGSTETTALALQQSALSWLAAPWNAPLILGMRAVAMPLACGNKVVLNASEESPAVHLAIGSVFHEAGFPKGVVSGRVKVDASDGPLEFYLKMSGAYAWMPYFSIVKQWVQARRGRHGTNQGGMVIKVRRARLSDCPAIAAFIREAYEELAPFKAQDRWAWQFVNNPYIGRHDGYVPVWIAESSGTVVGQIAVQDGVLQIDGAIYSAGWIVDVMILRSYRGLGLGHRLYAAVAEECPILVTLTMASATRRMAERLGAIDLREVKVYVRCLRLNYRTVQRYLRARTAYHPLLNQVAQFLCRYCFVHRVLARVGNGLFSLRDSLVSMPRARKATRIVETNWFGSEIDLLWRRLRHDFPVAFTRESKFLNWRFCECPQMRYRCFTASRDGSSVGYMVLRQTEPVELPQGIIVDLLAARQDRDTIEDLLAFALECFGNEVATIQCATSIPEFAAVLRSFGFHSVRTERPNCVVAEALVRKQLETRSKDWLLSKADHDWDQIHLA